MKTDRHGNLQWAKVMTGNNISTYGYAAKQTSDSGFILTGSFYDKDNLTYSSILMKLGMEGNVEWSFQYGFPDSYSLAADVQLAENGYLVAFGLDSLVIMNTDLDGNLLWAGKYDVHVINWADPPLLKLEKISDGNLLWEQLTVLVFSTSL